MAAEWTTPTAIHSYCGECPPYNAANTIDDDLASFWTHTMTCYHWIIFDMGETKKITKIRVYVDIAPFGGAVGLYVYVSDDPANFGDAVWEGVLNTAGWSESGAFEKDGRYIKLVSKRNTPGSRMYEFDAYAEAVGGQIYEINVDAVVKATAEKVLQTTYNIQKDAAVSSQAIEVSETTFNILKDVIVKSLADLGIETIYNISKDALVQALADVVVEKINDNFDDNSIDTTFWDMLEVGATVAEVNQRLEVTRPEVIGHKQSGLVTKYSHNLSEADLQISVVELDTLDHMQLMICLTKVTASDPYGEANWYRFFKAGATSTCRVQKRVDGATEYLYNQAWSAATGPLRIVISGGVISFYEDGNLVASESYALSTYIAYVYIFQSTNAELVGTDAFDDFIGVLEGQTYEINVDAVVKATAEKVLQTTYNIQKDAAVTSQALKASETIFNIQKEAIAKALTALSFELGIPVEAVVKASAVSNLESIFNISKEAVIEALATKTLQTIYNIHKDAAVAGSATHGEETTFNIHKDALVQALADVVVEKISAQIIEIFKDAVVTAQATFELESIFNVRKDIVVETLVSLDTETTFNIIKDAIIQAAATREVFGIYPINKDAVVQALTLLELQQVLNISKDAMVEVSAQAVTETIFNVVKDAIVKVSASPQITGIYVIPKDALVNAEAAAQLQQTLNIRKDAVIVSVSTPLIQSVFNLSPEAVVKVLAEVSIVKEGEVKVTKLFLMLGNIAIQIQGE